MGVAPGALEGLAPRDAETHPRRALQALAGRGHRRLERCRARIEGQGAERAHRVEEQPARVLHADPGDRLHGIHDSGSGLAVDHRDVGDFRIAGKGAVERPRIDWRVLRRLQQREAASRHLADLRHALPVGSVGEDEHLAVPGHEGAEHRFDHEGAAALQRNAHVGALPARDRDQPLAHLAVDVDEVTVARPVVMPRRLLDLR